MGTKVTNEPDRARVCYYRVFGLTLASTIDLPELEPIGAARPDVMITLGPELVASRTAAREVMSNAAGGLTLSVSTIGRFDITAGRSIIVSARPGTAAENLRIFLLGSAMGLTLHQRGVLPLHANAIEIDGSAVAFMGASGSGKSTLAAAFHDAGYPVHSDDVCAVHADGDRFIVQPGIPHLRLWRDALERTGRTCEDSTRVSGGIEKFTVTTQLAMRAEPLPLDAIYLLDRLDEGEQVEITRMSRIDALRATISNIYRGRYIVHTAHAAAQFKKIAALTAVVPVYRFARPWAPERITETLEAVRIHRRQMPSTQANGA